MLCLRLLPIFKTYSAEYIFVLVYLMNSDKQLCLPRFSLYHRFSKTIQSFRTPTAELANLKSPLRLSTEHSWY